MRPPATASTHLISPDLQLQHLRTYRETSSIECHDDVLAEITSDQLLASATPKAHIMENIRKTTLFVELKQKSS
ncbi:hypothetical protein BXOR1_17995 [Xanthomonas oryzae pv. oryzicola]|nr:hypothetical protein BE73_03580 [Xanthomonas oryzae pv. oryzicola]KOR40731.1 hypothetical protein ADT27_20115 [Xanthomonas oryzae]AKK65411.1 hypothetical protein FE36_17160 [Xanthomonas oryzae pv. oryzicola]AKN94683.1 hypothetical protein ACU13_18345 [Xanthomonas oryzae pv. oryzicola]AKN98406.1 hypothetical protein ACU10_18265 [Xanthomonas oryzae pv. oryzicola]